MIPGLAGRLVSETFKLECIRRHSGTPFRKKKCATLERQFGASLSDWSAFSMFFHLQNLEEGITGVRAGIVARTFYISNGLVRLYYVDQEGKRNQRGVL